MGSISGPELRRLREQRKLTQAVLAQACGLSQQHLSLLEKGASGMEVSTLEKILGALGYGLALVALPNPLPARLKQWNAYSERAQEPLCDLSPDARLAQAGELAELFLARHPIQESPEELLIRARAIKNWRAQLAWVRL